MVHKYAKSYIFSNIMNTVFLPGSWQGLENSGRTELGQYQKARLECSAYSVTTLDSQNERELPYLPR